MLKILLAPFALLYGIAIYVRNFLFDISFLKSTSFNKAIICVGNLTIGGTGKTPHIEYLIRLLEQKNKVATLSRGYKRKTKGFHIADQESSALQIGDEPYQIFKKFPNIIVSVDEKRVRGIENLLKIDPNIDVILLDDAFQHRYVKPGFSILLVDYNNLVTRDYFIPLGTLRDSVSQLSRADAVIVTKCPDSLKPIDQQKISEELKISSHQNIYFSKLIYGELIPVFSDNTDKVSLTHENKVMAVAGIANPKPFFNHLMSKYTVDKTIALADHFHFTEKKIKAIFDSFSQIKTEKKIIITTEKDASRLLGFSNLPSEIKKYFYYIPIEIEFLDNLEEDFNKKIKAYVREN